MVIFKIFGNIHYFDNKKQRSLYFNNFIPFYVFDFVVNTHSGLILLKFFVFTHLDWEDIQRLVDNLQESICLLYHSGSGEQTQVVRLGKVPLAAGTTLWALLF